MWRALRHRNFRLFFVSQLLSGPGTWVQQVAQGWLVLELSGDPFVLGLLAASQFGPVVLFGLLGGVVADLIPKRRILLVTQSIEMALAFALFGLTASGHVEVWHVLALSTILGLAHAVEWPTRQAFTIEMVGRDDLVSAIGINSATSNAARVVGPAIAGLIIGLVGTAAAFLVNAVTYLPVIVAIVLMRDAELRRHEVPARWTGAADLARSLGDGLRYAWGNATIRTTLAVVGLIAAAAMNFQVLVPPLARDVLGTDATGYGLLMATAGAGALVAAIGITVSGRIDPRAVAAAAIVLGAATLGLAGSRTMALSLVAMFFAGAGSIAMATAGNTMVQLAAPDTYRGRVMSVWTIVYSAAMPVGGLIVGWIASALGVTTAIAIGGGVALAIAVPTLLGRWIRAPAPVPVRDRP
jgi:MFS family permease